MALTETNLKAMAASAGDVLASEIKDWDTVSSASYAVLSKVKKADIIELKSYAKPPQLVQLVAEAALIALGNKDHSWVMAKKVMCGANIVSVFRSFEPKSVDKAMMAKLKPYVDNPAFEPASVKKVSAACCGIAMWVLAVYQYGAQ